MFWYADMPTQTGNWKSCNPRETGLPPRFKGLSGTDYGGQWASGWRAGPFNCGPDIRFTRKTNRIMTKMPRLIPIAKELLEQMYLVEDLPVTKVAELLDVAKSTVWHWLKDYGIPVKAPATQSEVRDGNGYIMVYMPGHHRANAVGRVKRSVLVWEKASGRPMPDDMMPHHANGVKDDDRPENIAAMTRVEHLRKHAKLREAATGTKSFDTRHRKLERAQAVEIRQRALAGEPTGALAVEFGVSPANISNIKYGRYWR